MADDWQAVCGHCGTFDSFAWQTPPRAGAGLAADETVARLETGGAGQAQAEVEDAEATDVTGKPAARAAGLAGVGWSSRASGNPTQRVYPAAPAFDGYATRTPESGFQVKRPLRRRPLPSGETFARLWRYPSVVLRHADLRSAAQQEAEICI